MAIEDGKWKIPLLHNDKQSRRYEWKGLTVTKSPSERKDQVKFNGVGRLRRVRGARKDGKKATEALRWLSMLGRMVSSLALACSL